MDYPYWQKQVASKPLFEDLIWSKPQQKALSGKLLIIGGNLHAVSAPVAAFDTATEQGVGECKVILPSSTKKLFGPKPPPEIIFIQSTPSGSFSSQAFDDIKSYLEWTNATLLAGDFGRNSETTILLDNISKIDGPQIYCGDAIDNLLSTPQLLAQNSQIALVLDVIQLQKLVVGLKYPRAVKLDMSLIQLVEFLHDFSAILPCHIMVDHQQEIIAASGGQIVTTKSGSKPIIPVQIAASSAVWWLQNPSKPLQALTTAITQI